ncbi:MAG: dethiobiotin synthase [Myxococcales bacterium]|nr:dethiobiotin synthase [Myxococcales bacterium]
MRGLFISGVGTGVGKTYVTRGLARALSARGRVAAFKPLETGVAPAAEDALALSRACQEPGLAALPGLYRAAPPLAPWAATLAGEPPPPSLEALRSTLRAASAPFEWILVEAAGGLLAPIDAEHTMAELARALALPILLVASNGLGVLSYVLTAAESAERRGLPIEALVLVDAERRDPSQASNARILEQRLQRPALRFRRCPNDDDALAAEAARAGLIDLPALAAR